MHYCLHNEHHHMIHIPEYKPKLSIFTIPNVLTTLYERNSDHNDNSTDINVQVYNIQI